MARRYYESPKRVRMEESRGMGKRFSEKGEYSEQEYGNMHEPHGDPQGPVNKNSQKYNDEWNSDKDPSQEGMLRRPLSSSELFAGMPTSMRKGLEKEGQMIGEDHRAIANLPQEVMIKSYPHVGPYMPEDLEDSVVGVDSQMEYDDEQRALHFYPKKH